MRCFDCAGHRAPFVGGGDGADDDLERAETICNKFSGSDFGLELGRRMGVLRSCRLKVEGKGLPRHCLDLHRGVSTIEAERVLI